jgi:Fur family ferric uptake transcriptional regulator
MSRSPTRRSRQGQAVLGAVREADGFRTAQDIHAQLRDSGHPVGLTTVYRQLQGLADDGVIDGLQRGDGQTVYRHCDTTQHHHHIVCRRCGSSLAVDAPAIEAWAHAVAHEARYTDITHTVEIFGVCPACSGPSGDGAP